MFYWQEDPSKIQQGRKSEKWLKVEIIAVKGPMAAVNPGATIVQTNISNLRRPLDTVDLEELLESRERAGAPVLWLSCEGQTDVWEMFSDYYLRAKSLIGKDLKLQLQLTVERRRLRVSRHSCYRASGTSSRKRIPRLL